MKKNLIYLFALVCSMGLFIACSDDEKPEVPPTVEDIVAEYSADNLKATIEGATVSTENAKIELAKGDASDKVTIILHNVVPGVAEFKIPNAEFAATTRSMYISTLKGEATDNVAGYNVKVDGTVDNKILTVNIALTEVQGENINTSSLYNLVYKGKMAIDVANIPEPISMEQRVYVAKARSTNMAKRDTSMVKLTIKNFSFQGMALGDITLDTVLVQKRGEVLAFKADNRKLKFATLGEVGANLKGTIVDNKMTLNLDIDASGLKVAVGFDGNPVKEIQTVSMAEMTIEGAAIIEQKKETNSLTLKIWENTPDKDLLLTPKYKLSDKGSIEYIFVHVSGKEDTRLTKDQIDGKQPIDFSVLKGEDDYIGYHMLAEDPNVAKDFEIKIERWAVETVYDMTEWVGGQPKGMMSSNDAASLLPFMGITLPKDPGAPVTKAADGSARITTFKTLNAKEENPTLVPALTAGTLFIGDFEIDVINTLKSTKFGIPTSKKPTNLKFTYKYTPGTTVYESVKQKSSDGKSDVNVAKVRADLTDECSIMAYLYEVSDYSETLDGTNINTSSKVVLKAALNDGTAKSDYVERTIPFESTGNGTFDTSKKYKLAIVCTPSKLGDKFIGADLSSLYIKYISVE